MKTNTGATLIELLVYIAIFSICMITVLTTTVYMQKIFERGMSRYVHAIDVYVYMSTMQTYLLSAKGVDLSIGDVRMFMGKSGDAVVTFKIVDGFLSIVHNSKVIHISNSRFDSFSVTSASEGGVGDTFKYMSEHTSFFRWGDYQKKYTMVDRVLLPNR